MKCLIAFGLLVTLASVICEDDPVEAVEPVVEPAVVPKPRPVGIVYLIQLFNEPPVPAGEDDEITNVVPSGNPYKTSKLLLALTPNNFDQDKDVSREKRSPGYGKGGGGGGCNVCGGGGGGYPGGGGHGGGGYPGGGGGFGGGGGGGGSWSQSSAQASSGSFGYGGGGKGYKG